MQEALLARLDRLSTARQIAQLGAALGREFSHELIHAVATLSEADLDAALAKLVEAEILYQRGIGEQAQYFFKHALIQDTAYQSLLKSTRQQYHQQIASTLEERFRDIKETQPELVAHHYTEAGRIAQAIPYWRHAGRKAMSRSAHGEAISHLTKGLELLKVLPATPERSQQELEIQIALSTPLIALKGFTAIEVEHACSRARELCQQIGETPQLFAVIGQLQSLYLNRGELQTAYELATQLLRLAQRTGKPRLLLWAHYALGFTLTSQGELVAGRTHFEQSLTFYDPHHQRLTDFVQDPRVTGLAFLALILYELGYADQARRRAAEALLCARQLSHPFSLAFTLHNSTEIYKALGEEQAAREFERELMSLSREQGFTFWLVEGTIHQGVRLVEEGQNEEGITQILQAVEALQAMGERGSLPFSLYRLGDAYGKAGQVALGLRTLDEAFTTARQKGDLLIEAQIYWRKGELTLQQESEGQRGRSAEQKFGESHPHAHIPDPESEAEAYFRKAIEIARKQQAQSLKLRAATSLARLWQQQGKRAEAHAMLSEIYGWFTEGFDTKDLQEAKALMEELA